MFEQSFQRFNAARQFARVQEGKIRRLGLFEVRHVVLTLRRHEIPSRSRFIGILTLIVFASPKMHVVCLVLFDQFFGHDSSRDAPDKIHLRVGGL